MVYPYPLRTIDGITPYTVDIISSDNVVTQNLISQNLVGTLSTGGTLGQVHYTDSSGQVAFTGSGTVGQVLTSNGVAAPTFQTPPIPINAPNISGGLAGQIPVQTAPSTTSFIPTTTAGFVLTANGIGTTPSFQAVASPSGALPNITTLTSGSSFTSTVGCLRMKVEIYGASAGGNCGGGSQLVNGAGGGSGSYCRGYFSPGTYAYVIGGNGAAAAASAAALGGAGGSTSWSSGAALMVCSGGSVGSSANVIAGKGGLGGTVSGVGRSYSFNGGGGGIGPSAGFGGVGKGGGNASGIRSSGSTNAGNAGGQYGGGGGGSANVAVSGGGWPGAIIITEYF